MLSPGEHVIDNRPGWIPVDGTNYRLRDGTTSSDFTPFNTTSNFDLTSSVNDLYKLNSVHGGVIVPRGVSIVGSDLRKPQFDHYTFLILRMMILKDLRFSESQVDVTFSNLRFLTEIPTETSIEITHLHQQ